MLHESVVRHRRRDAGTEDEVAEIGGDGKDLFKQLLRFWGKAHIPFAAHQLPNLLLCLCVGSGM